MTAQSTDSRGRIIRKVKQFTARDFRGLVGEHTFDTDADIVLLAGSNGHGKTSFIEALLLLLTDHHYYPQKGNGHGSAENLFSLKDRSPASSFEITAEADGGRNFTLCCSRDNGDSLRSSSDAKNDDIRTNWLKEDQIKEPGLSARLCAFFQDRMQELFDEWTRGGTLRSILEPVPLQKYWFDEQAKELKSILGKAVEKLNDSTTGDFDNVQVKLLSILEDLQVHYRALRDRRPDLPETLPSEPNNEQLRNFALEVLKLTGKSIPPDSDRLPDELTEALYQLLNGLIRAARRDGQRDPDQEEAITRELEQINYEIEEIDRKHPDLMRNLRLFSADEGEPGLFSIFDALARYRDKWAGAQLPHEAETAKRLQQVIEEITAVSKVDAGGCAQMLKAWLAPLEETQQRRNALEWRKRKLKADLKMIGISREVSFLEELQKTFKDRLPGLVKNWQDLRRHLRWREEEQLRNAVRAHLENAQDAVEKVRKQLGKKTEASDELKDQLAELVNTVASRFSFVEGIFPLHLGSAEDEQQNAQSGAPRQIYQTTTEDGRQVRDFSTGQRGQVGVSLLIAQNQVLQHLFSHRILLLDDVSTSYDLSNLTREAILWRQLAYAREEKDEETKHENSDGKTPASEQNKTSKQDNYQLFISTHHEDLINHTLDLLVPPRGRKMRMIRFNDWTPKDGPDFGQFSVIPSGEGDAAEVDYLQSVRESLRKEIGEVLK